MFDRLLLSILAFPVCIMGHSSAQDPKVKETTYLEEKEELLAERERLNQTVWKQETLAQLHEQSIVKLWDALLDMERRGEGDPYDVFAALPLSSIQLGKPAQSKPYDHAIEMTTFEKGTLLDQEGWKAWLTLLKSQDYRLYQSEWHHAKFRPGSESEGAHSEVSMSLHLTSPNDTRVIIDGMIDVEWSLESDAEGRPLPLRVDATGVRMLTRQGKPVFEPWFQVDPREPGKPAGIHPLHVYDLDADGRLEVIAAGCNLKVKVNPDGTIEKTPFLAHGERFHEAGLIADLTGDGWPDFIAPDSKGDLLLFEGSEGGVFSEPPLGKTREGGPLKQPTAITAGDIDLDGDLDLWVGQYRISYVLGTMPSPYYDANDGFPSYLLLNSGDGKFAPSPEEEGLEAKRNRRTYTASFVDLDDDHDLDLLVVSDFAGVDVYENDGAGRFTDVTDTMVDERHLFGMSATFSDYNLDGLLDFYVAGMGSTTARRLEAMGATRDDDPNVERMRMVMGYGNRMYLRNGPKSYQQPEFKDRVARTGWTWGTTSLDFDNDRDPDIFVANGHASGESTKDHCSIFWCHDIYRPSITPNRALHEVFQTVHEGYLNRTESWDGYQKSHLLMNIQGQDFLNIAFLMGVADQFDGRAALSGDLDGDGRVDLLIVEDLWQDGQILHAYRNVMETDNHWIGVQLREEPGRRSPVGAHVTIETDAGNLVGVVATGETLHGQHSNQLHFGLGKATTVKAIEVTWPGGTKERIEAPSIDQYHPISSAKVP